MNTLVVELFLLLLMMICHGRFNGELNGQWCRKELVIIQFYILFYYDHFELKKKEHLKVGVIYRIDLNWKIIGNGSFSKSKFLISST